jgi:6-phosphofructo-2-kinase
MERTSVRYMTQTSVPLRVDKRLRSLIRSLKEQNGTKKARLDTRNRFEALGIQVMFIENVCDDNQIIEANIRAVKLSSPDVSHTQTVQISVLTLVCSI